MKAQTIYICQQCGAKSPKMLGRCPVCGEWGTYVEETIERSSIAQKTPKVLTSGMVPKKLTDIETAAETRIDMQSNELNRVLGGGLVQGSMILLGGEPGIGKSTLALQVLMRLEGHRTLYASGEESARQLKMRAERLAGSADDMYILSETSLEKILEHTTALRPEILVIDSIQTVGTETIEASIGSLSQVRECANILLKYAKETGTACIIVGHINKEGAIAGPKVLEHIVDTVLQFEGDQHYLYRILRAQKNRFGNTSELGIFEMRQDGLREVTNPSELLLTADRSELSGIAVAAAIEGIRPILIEVQGLVSSAAYGTPQRSTTGFDQRRLNMLLAVLEKRIGFKLMQKDVFVNIAGGLRVNDPAIDLAILAAVLSSNTDIALPADTCLTGEVGLAGEIRPVPRIEQRIMEAQKLGFKRIIVPAANKIPATGQQQSLAGSHSIEICPVRKVQDAFRLLMRPL